MGLSYYYFFFLALVGEDFLVDLAFVFFAAFFEDTFFPFGDFVFPVAFFGADLLPATFTFPAVTNFSTVHATLTERTSSPDFTSTIESPFVAARLRKPAASSRVDLGANFFR